MRIPPVRFGESYRLSFKEGNNLIQTTGLDGYANVAPKAASFDEFMQAFMKLGIRLEKAQQKVAKLLTEAGVKSSIAMISSDALNGNYLLTNGAKAASVDAHMDILSKLKPVTATDSANKASKMLQGLMNALTEDRELVSQGVVQPNSPEIIVQFHLDDKNEAVVDNLPEILNQVKP